MATVDVLIPPSYKRFGSYGGQSTGGEGKPFYLGGGGRRVIGQGSGGGMPQMTPEDEAALRWWYDQTSKSFGQGQERLAPGQFAGSALGQGAQSRYLNPTGMDPAVLERVKSELAAMFSGARKDQLANFNARASASGFGDSQGAITGAQQIEAQNAQDLVSAITQVLFQNEDYKLQQSGQAAGLAGLLQQLEAAMSTQSAQGHFNREYPMYNMDEAGGGYQYIDPNTGQVNYAGPWTQAAFEQMQKERMRWESERGRMS